MAHQFFFNPFILDNLPAPRTGFDVVQDLSDPRLRMYITSRGVKTFFVRKRVHNRDRRIIIGNYPDMDIEDARAAVPEILAKAMQKTPTRHRQIKFRKFLDLYLANRVRRGQYSREKLVRAINRHLSQLFDKNLSDITPDEIAAIIENISGRAIAGRMQELLQSVFNYAIETGHGKVNPVLKIPKVIQNRRVRPLNKYGLNKLITAIGREENQILRAAFLMLIYGFATKSQVFAMQWSELDFNHYTWGSRPLSDAAVVVLQNLPQDSRWVFPGRGRGHLTDPRCAWRRVTAAAGIPDLTMDDVYKFLMRKLDWVAAKEDLRINMNQLLNEILN